MKKKVLFMIASMMAAGTLNAQTVNDGQFNIPTVPLPDISTATVGSWMKGDAKNTFQSGLANAPEIILDGNNKVLKLNGTYDLSVSSQPAVNLETAAQDIGLIPSGKFTVTFQANNQLQNWQVLNPGLDLRVMLKSHTGATDINPTPPNAHVLNGIAEINLGINYTSYSVTFCVPPSLKNQLRYLEFVPTQKNTSNTYFDGTINIDNVIITNTSEPYDLAFDYRIDCLTGQVQVMRTTSMNSNLSELFYIIENNPNDPNNQNGIGDVQVASAWFTPNSLGWHTIPFNLERGKNYYLKRGIWGPCMSWKELRKYNVEMQADQFNTNFDINVLCDNGAAILSVTGADQLGKNPLNMFSLYEHFPGTSNSAQLLESITWWQQSGGSNYQYQQGPFSFNTPLDPTKHYYVKRGVWDACTPWAEKRRYDVYGLVCPKNASGNLTIGTDNQQTDNVELFPNPVSEILTIATDLEYDEVQLFTIGGKFIGTYSSSSINVSKLERGSYLLRFVKGGSILTTERFIKE